MHEEERKAPVEAYGSICWKVKWQISCVASMNFMRHSTRAVNFAKHKYMQHVSQHSRQSSLYLMHIIRRVYSAILFPMINQPLNRTYTDSWSLRVDTSRRNGTCMIRCCWYTRRVGHRCVAVADTRRRRRHSWRPSSRRAGTTNNPRPHRTQRRQRNDSTAHSHGPNDPLDTLQHSTAKTYMLTAI